MGQRALLASGVIAPLLYVATDMLLALRWEDYSYRDQTISELNAIGAPTRPLSIALGLAGYLLLAAFGLGVWRSAPVNRRLRVAGGVLVVFAIQALWAVPFAPMSVRGVERSLSDTLHLVDGAAAGLLLGVAIGFAAAALGRRFRFYSIATVLVVVAFAAWSGLDGPRIAENLATPWVGVKERIAVYAYQLWLVVLGLTLLRGQTAANTLSRGGAEQVLPRGESTLHFRSEA